MIQTHPQRKKQKAYFKRRDQTDAPGLNPRERSDHRFGLEIGHPLTLEEVGKRFKVTRERIRQIETAALRKLRNPSRSKKNQGFSAVAKGHK